MPSFASEAKQSPSDPALTTVQSPHTRGKGQLGKGRVNSLTPSAAAGRMMWGNTGGVMADWILRGGTVIDGSGGPRRRADVAGTGGRDRAVGKVAKTAGAREIGAAGLVVAPGFIDVHTHDDRALLASDMAAKVSQGVTTVITGNCGISLAPLSLKQAPPPPLDLIGEERDYGFGGL